MGRKKQDKTNQVNESEEKEMNPEMTENTEIKDEVNTAADAETKVDETTEVNDEEATNTEVTPDAEEEKEYKEITCPHCGGTIKIEVPKKPVSTGGGRRGQLAGLKLSEMSDAQLKIELINAHSVLYKAQKRNASSDVIAKNQARVDAAEAEKKARAAKVEPAATEATATTQTEIDPKSTDESVYNADVENEI
jgi:hypothetical protein